MTREKRTSGIFLGSATAYALAAAMCVMTSVYVAPAVAQVELPKEARPLTAYELLVLFGDKTWLWDSGAVRFFIADRRAVAWVENENGPSVAEGRFRLTDKGRLCIEAKWTFVGASADKRTCFLHREADGKIFQKPADAGDWYLFKDPTASVADESSKLVDDDRVSDKAAEIKTRLSGGQ